MSYYERIFGRQGVVVNKIAMIVLLMCTSSFANAGLMTSLAAQSVGTSAEETLTQASPVNTDDISRRMAELFADPLFLEQQRALAEQSAGDVEALIEAIRVADEHFDCTKHRERADCVQRNIDQARRQESIIGDIENLEITLAYVTPEADMPVMTAQLESLTQVSEPSLLTLALFTLLLGMAKRCSRANLA